MLNIFKKKEKFDCSRFGLGLIPSQPDERDLYIRFVDNNGTIEVYKIVNGKHVHVRFDEIKAV